MNKIMSRLFGIFAVIFTMQSTPVEADTVPEDDCEFFRICAEAAMASRQKEIPLSHLTSFINDSTNNGTFTMQESGKCFAITALAYDEPVWITVEEQENAVVRYRNRINSEMGCLEGANK